VQVPRHLVRAAVKVLVGESLALELDRYCAGCARGLRLEELMERLAGG
jgi:hypothetical protein